MVKLTQEMIDAFNANKYFPFATASKDGEPNVAPMGSVFLIDPETIWIGNNFMNASIKNAKENSKGCLLLWTQGVKTCFKIKGDLKVLESGEEYEQMKQRVKSRRADLNCRSLIIFKITGVYNCLSGSEAGKKLL